MTYRRQERLLLWLATTESSSELHGGGTRSGSSGLVSVSGLPVGFSVGLLGHASGSGGSGGARSGLSLGLSLEGGGDDLWGQVEVVAEILDSVSLWECLLRVAGTISGGRWR